MKLLESLADGVPGTGSIPACQSSPICQHSHRISAQIVRRPNTPIRNYCENIFNESRYIITAGATYPNEPGMCMSMWRKKHESQDRI